MPILVYVAGRALGVVAACAIVVAGAAVAAVSLFSGASLSADPTALARIRLDPFAGSIESVSASTPAGAALPLDVQHGRLMPRTKLDAGQTVDITVVVRRPRWSSWALGRSRRERLTVLTPLAHVVRRWLTVTPGRRPEVRFDAPVSAVAIGGRTAVAASSTVSIPTRSPAGSTTIAAAARPWERLGAPVRVTWFPRSSRTVLLAHPAPGSLIRPLTPLRLTFSQPLSRTRLSLTPVQSGSWVKEDSHTLEFRPSGYGAPLAADETVQLPETMRIAGGSRKAKTVSWRVAAASFLRLQQLLAQEGYLPLTWSPAGADVARTRRAELTAATSPPSGTFRWRYPNTPHELVSLWRTGQPNQITRGAVMMFEHDHGLAVDGIAGPQVWHTAIADMIDGRRKTGGYSYVFVHRNVPQLLTLWHDGHVVLTSPGNTGVPAAPTQLGTWPVFEHIPIGRMSGTNPDGSHYNDPGIRWISYFHGGEALHAFNRASFGTPQSLGCVELPLDAAAKLWGYTPIGTLVTIED